MLAITNGRDSRVCMLRVVYSYVVEVERLPTSIVLICVRSLCIERDDK